MIKYVLNFNKILRNKLFLTIIIDLFGVLFCRKFIISEYVYLVSLIFVQTPIILALDVIKIKIQENLMVFIRQEKLCKYISNIFFVIQISVIFGLINSILLFEFVKMYFWQSVLMNVLFSIILILFFENIRPVVKNSWGIIFTLTLLITDFIVFVGDYNNKYSIVKRVYTPNQNNGVVYFIVLVVILLSILILEDVLFIDKDIIEDDRS